MLLKNLTARVGDLFRNDYELLRCPERLPKCYEMTEAERQQAIMKLNRNVWNDYTLTEQDNL